MVQPDKTITISVFEYKRLLDCKAMIDMVLAGTNDKGFADIAVIKAVISLRKLHADMLFSEILDALMEE